MSDKDASFAEKVSRLRAVFLERLPKRLAEARCALDILRSVATPAASSAGDRRGGPTGLGRGDPGAEALVSLRRILHNLKGTGESFGFKELSSRTQECERELDAAFSSALESAGIGPGDCRAEGAGTLAEFERGFAELESCAAELMAAGPRGAQGDGGFARPPASAQPGIRRSESLVYVCDDDSLQAELIADQLKYFGYRAKTFTRTRDLRAAVLAEAPAAVVMDLMFPGGECEGADALSGLRSEGVCVPAVFISGRGDFEARIRAVRAGGVAYYTKPLEANELMGTIDEIAHPREAEPFRILVVDDEPDVARYHQLILEEAGMTVRVAELPETVLDLVKGFRPDLVLMDVYMPRCSGREVATLIRQIPDFLSLPIIFLSAETDKAKQFSAMSVGAEGFLTKPIEPRELVNSVSLRAERMRTLRSLMSRDSLTGLFNHTTTTELLRSSVDAAKRGCRPLCFAMIDLDRFKSVNDSYGHPVGDQVLLAVSRVLKRRLRNSDLVGRYGGEEFAVILADTDLDAAVNLMEVLREDFSRVLFHAGERTFSCTFSCGISMMGPTSTHEAVREAADINLYKAKEAGRNRLVAGRMP